MIGVHPTPLASLPCLPRAAEVFGRLSIILVNYNGMPYLQACLGSVKRFAPATTEVILVDNASSDQSVALVSRSFPWVRVERSQQNRGFAAGNNLGAKRASGDVLLLLNTDTVLLEPIEPALLWFQHHREYGALTIKMLNRDRVASACTGRFPTPLRLAVIRNMLVKPHTYTPGIVHDVDWVQGSFMLMRTEVWRALGGMDERYFMYFEDVELCRRIKDEGLKCGYLPAISYLHFGGFNSARFPLLIDNLCFYIQRHFKGWSKLLARSILLLGCMARAALYSLRATFIRNSANVTLSRACGKALQIVCTGMHKTPSSASGSRQ